MSYAALAISVMALLFTIASFWWLHARPGNLRTYEPTTWAAYVARERSAIRLPLVLHNEGAATVVVSGLRLRFPGGQEIMAWEWTRTRVDPRGDDVQDVTAPFSIPGRQTKELVAEFVGQFPGVVPEPRAHEVVIEAQCSLHHGWRPVLAFDLQLQNLLHPGNYIVYTNQADYLSEEELGEGAANLARLREQWNLAIGRPSAAANRDGKRWEVQLMCRASAASFVSP